MLDKEDESIQLGAIKASLEVIESNTCELKQIKESLQNIEQLLEDLLATVNETAGMLVTDQEPDSVEPVIEHPNRNEVSPYLFHCNGTDRSFCGCFSDRPRAQSTPRSGNKPNANCRAESRCSSHDGISAQITADGREKL